MGGRRGRENGESEATTRNQLVGGSQVTRTATKSVFLEKLVLREGRGGGRGEGAGREGGGGRQRRKGN